MTGVGRASFTQERFYFLNELQPGNPAYVVAFALRMEGALDRAALRDALHRVAAKHEVLRTGFAVRDGELVQRVAEQAEPEITLRDAGPADRAGQDAELRALVAAEAARPFDLAAGRVLRAHVVSWTADQHALVVLVHHIACDGWAVGLLLDDLAEEYSTGAGAPAGPSYLDYARAQRALWSKNTRRLDHWHRTLADAPRLTLRTDHPRPGVLSFAGAVLRRPVDPELIGALTAWAKERGTTLFGVALTAYAKVLAAYARQQEVVIGVPVANRLDEEEERLVGCLVNTLPIRVDLTGDPDFAALTARTWRTALTALGHQDVPFEQIVRAVGGERQLSHAPLFQTMLTVQNFSFTVPEFAGLRTTEVDVEIEAAKFDLALTLDVSTRTPFLRVEYSTELFEPATAERLLDQYHTLLAAVVGDGEPDLVAPDEHHRLTVGWNPPVPERAAEHPSVLGAFVGHAARTPDAVALVHRGTSVSYGELDRWSDRIAAGLAAAGVGRGDRVGLLLGRSPVVVAAILGVWKAGGVYVPLDPEYPRPRLELILASAAPATLLVEPATLGPARELAGERTLLDATTLDGPTPADGALPAPDDLAYLIYTSGSTGVPKGVMVRHRGLNALCDPTPAGLETGPGDRWLGAHSFSFDVSVWEMWGALSSGARLVVADQADLVDPSRLARLAHTEQVTVLSLTPGALYRLLPPFFDTLGPGKSPVRYVVLAGEALSWSRLASLVDPERMPAVFVNMYGITEGTIHVTVAQVPAADLGEVRDGDIGVPLPSARCYVLDGRRRPTGVNVPGELYVGGDLVAAGYLGMPELTAARFGADPYAPGTLYRTGDLALWAPDGRLVYLGREDAQVKIRGFRVELADVEAAFLRQAGVRSCVAAAEADELVAFVVADPALGERELRALVREELPGYLVPSRIVPVERIPLNANGKIDSRRLLAEAAGPAPAAPAPASAASAEHRSGDRSLTERIRAIWAEVLRRPDLEAGDNFFDVGGHSFALITVQQRMAEIGLEISVTDLFRFGTAAACAAHFRPAPTAPAADEQLAQRRQGREQLARRRRLSRGDEHA
ncbi:amino acid adenylation domain-containing protein [Kitasatospora sp. NPDC048365]|uniref:non-ribosomal peptide synthetase n=1 Tax=Kitasatospora sp. NPDC048365 TaxID=3364050 RepID=UPI003720A732